MSHKNHHSASPAEQEREKIARNRRRMYRLWLWIGVIILCALLFFWIFDIGTFIGPNQ